MNFYLRILFSLPTIAYISFNTKDQQQGKRIIGNIFTMLLKWLVEKLHLWWWI